MKMCKLIGIVYFIFIVVIRVNSDDVKEESHEENIKLSEHHDSEANLNEPASTINPEIFDSNDNAHNLEEASIKIQDKSEDNPEQFARSGKAEDPTTSATEVNGRRSAEHPKATLFIGSLARAIHDKLSDEASNEADASSRLGAPEDTAENTESGEFVIMTPPKNSLNQDHVIDTKARTGRVDEEHQLEKGDDESDELSKENIPHRNSDNYLRSGFVSTDDDDGLRLPKHNFRGGLTPALTPSGYLFDPLNNNQRHEFPWLRNTRPDSPIQTFPRFTPPLYENFKSGEMFYTTYNSPEILSQPYPDLRAVPKQYNGQNNVNNQLFNSRSREICSPCHSHHSTKLQPQEPNFRRSLDPNPFETTNGRPIAFDPNASNNYPLQLDNLQHKEESQNLNSRLHDVINVGKDELPNSKEVKANPSEMGQLTRPLFSTPPYNIPRNSPYRRIGLSGVQRFIL